MAQVLGLVQVSWRGTPVPIEKGAKLKLGGLQQKPVITGQQVNYETEYEASEITVTTTLRRGDSLLTLYAPGQGALIVTCDTGQTYSWDDAFLAKRPELSDGGGKSQLMWNAGEASELLNTN
jgi:hypothetical protein